MLLSPCGTEVWRFSGFWVFSSERGCWRRWTLTGPLPAGNPYKCCLKRCYSQMSSSTHPAWRGWSCPVRSQKGRWRTRRCTGRRPTSLAQRSLWTGSQGCYVGRPRGLWTSHWGSSVRTSGGIRRCCPFDHRRVPISRTPGKNRNCE